MSTSSNRPTVAMTIAVALWSPHTLSDTAAWQYPGNQHFYKQYDVNLTPQNAYRFCSSKGAYAASIGGARENSFVAGMLRTSGVRSTMIGLTLREMVQVKNTYGLVRYELRGQWADGAPFVYRSDEDPADPAAQNSFERFETIPYGVDVTMNSRGTWHDTWAGRILSKSKTTIAKPYRTETYVPTYGIRSITCEWDAAPDNP